VTGKEICEIYDNKEIYDNPTVYITVEEERLCSEIINIENKIVVKNVVTYDDCESGKKSMRSKKSIKVKETYDKLKLSKGGICKAKNKLPSLRCSSKKENLILFAKRLNLQKINCFFKYASTSANAKTTENLSNKRDKSAHGQSFIHSPRKLCTLVQLCTEQETETVLTNQRGGDMGLWGRNCVIGQGVRNDKLED
jgi:hypothetical protein